MIARPYSSLNDRLYESWAWAFDPLADAFSLENSAGGGRAALPYISGRRVLELGC